MTVDEARAKMGRQFAQKGAEPEAAEGRRGSTPYVLNPGRAGTYTVGSGEGSPGFEFTPARSKPVMPPPAAASLDPEVIKAAVAEATSELKDLLVKQQETFTTKLAEQQQVIDAIADQPDPSTAAFSGLAFNPVRKAARPAGVTEIAEAAERAQRAYRTGTAKPVRIIHSDPHAREAYHATLTRCGGARLHENFPAPLGGLWQTSCPRTRSTSMLL